MSLNLGGSDIGPGAANPETAANTRFGRIDAAITETLIVDLSASNGSVTLDQAQQAVFIQLTGAAVARNCALPVCKRVFFVRNSGTANVTFTRGTAQVIVEAGTTAIVRLNGDTDGMFAIQTGAGSVAFTELEDAPASYTGHAGRLVSVKTDESGLQFIDKSTVGSTVFTELDDVPASYTGQSGKVVAVNSAANALEFITPSSGGASTFTGLTDTPASYTGQANKIVAINPGENALEFINAPAVASNKNHTTAYYVSNPPKALDFTTSLVGTGLTVSTEDTEASFNMTRNGVTTSDRMWFLGNTAPAGTDWYVEVGMIAPVRQRARWARFGPALRESTTDKTLTWGIDNNGGSPRLALFYMTNKDTYSSVALPQTLQGDEPGVGPWYFRIRRNGANYECYYSHTFGRTWILFGTVAISSYFTADQVGIGFPAYDVAFNSQTMTLPVVHYADTNRPFIYSGQSSLNRSVVTTDPLNASPVLPTKGQIYKPGITLEGTFSRAAAAYYRDGSGYLRSAASGVARYDNDPTTGEHYGLLFEGSRTNSIQYSEEFSNAYWTKTNATITDNAATAPNLTLTADKFVAANGQIGVVQRGLALTAGTTYTISIYAKAAELSIFQMLMGVAAFSSGTNRYAVFDLSAKTATSFNVTGAEFSSEIRQLANGWYRCIIVVKPDVTATVQPQLVRSNANGDGVSGLFIWGATLETGAHASSYIHTPANASVTRPGDILIHDGGDWLNSIEGTFFYRCFSSGASTGQQLIGGMSNTASPSSDNTIYTDFSPTNSIRTIARSGAAPLFTLTAAISKPKNNIFRIAVAYGPNDVAMSVDGAAPVTVAATLPTVLDRWVVGSTPHSPGTLALFGGMLDARYVPRRLSNTILQRMTS